MPEWNWITGHLLIFQRYISKRPSDAFISVSIADMAREMPTELFYLDLWPFLNPAIIVSSPEAANQASTTLNLPKAKLIRDLVDPVTGGPNMLTTDGKEWKSARSLFNPGFAPQYMLGQVPVILDSIEIFCDHLRKRATGKVFPLEELATRLTMDIIMKVAMDIDLNYQRQSHPLADALRKMISWCNFGNPFYAFHPIRPLAIKYYGNIMDKIIIKELDKRVDEYKQGRRDAALGSVKDTKSKSVMALALESYLADKGENAKLDNRFKAFASNQARLFLFAGHDTTTSVLVYTFHMLHKHPEVRARVCEEHNQVFGSDPNVAVSKLRASPALLNQIPYTTAVIKETMRFYPPSGAMREGIPGAYLTDHNGTQYPTDGFFISQLHLTIHTNPRVWARPKEFLPERWIVDSDHPLHVPPHAFRVFELGPRNCIGQTLSMVELRVALVMTARTLRIRPAYEEWDAMKKEGFLAGVFKKVGMGSNEKKEIDGDRAYMVEKGAAHPAQEYPCVVELLDRV